MREDGAKAKSGTETELGFIGPTLGFHAYSHCVKDDVPAWANNLGRVGNVNWMTGGKAISELIIFNRSLTDNERIAVECYQLEKWGLPLPVALVTTACAVTDPISFFSLTVDRGPGTYEGSTTGSFAVDASVLSADEPAIRVLGEFRKGVLPFVTISATGTMPSTGTYKLLQFANLFNCDKDGFVLSGFPDNARLYWNDDTLMVRFLETPSPLVPSVLSATGDAAPWIWLDASDAATFTTNEQGGVTAWADKGARGNDATAYQIGASQQYGTVGTTNGVTAYLMGACGSGIDLQFSRTATARTMFWVMDIALSNYETNNERADFLGDSSSLGFQRGGTGQYCATTSTQKPFWSGVVHEDGGLPQGQRINGPSYQIWRCKPYEAGSTHVYSLQAASEMSACYLSAELGCSTDATANMNGGRALSELVIFNRALSAAEVADVEAYMALKWFGTTTNVAASVDATARVSYPNLTLGDGAAFTVRSHRLTAKGEAAVTVYGFCEKTGSAKITVTNLGERSRPGVVLFRCAGSYGLSLESFTFVGFPEGTTFALENNELKVVNCPVAGLSLIVR